MLRIRFVALIVVSVLVLPAAGAFGVESSPFQGAWVTTSDGDGSRNMLIVGGGNNHVIYRETGLSACESAFGEFVGGSVSGFGEIDGDTLTFTGTLYCNLSSGRTPHPYFTNFDWEINYYPEADGHPEAVRLGDDPLSEMTRPGRRG